MRSKKPHRLVQHQCLKPRQGVKLHWEEVQLFKEVPEPEPPAHQKEAEKIDVKAKALDEAPNYNTDVLDSLKKIMDSQFLVSV